MKKLLMLFLFFPFFAGAQDYIEFKSGEIFNCKVLSSTKDEVVFVVDSVNTRKVPKYLIKSVNIGKTTTKQNAILIDPIKNTTIEKIELITVKKDTVINDNRPTYSYLKLAGIERKKALNEGLACSVIISSTGLIAVITATPAVFVVGAVAGIALGISSLIHDYNSANHLIQAGE